jgi:hypothetical protein
LRINYAKKESDVIAKMRGTFDEEAKAKREVRKLQENKIRDIKYKKKLIDKLLKLRADTEDMMVVKKQKIGAGGKVSTFIGD